MDATTPLSEGQNVSTQLPLNLFNASVPLMFKVIPVSSHLSKIVIEINSDIVNSVYKSTVPLFCTNVLEGFEYEHVPQEFIEETYKNDIINKAHDYIFKHLIYDNLFYYLLNQKICFVNYPRFSHIDKSENGGLAFSFDLSLTDILELKEWRNFAFRTPKRKRYKDLDKQVKQFIDEETSLSKKQNMEQIEDGDWVCFSAKLVTENHEATFPCFTNLFWVKVKTGAVPNTFSQLFCDKRVGNSFFTNEPIFDDSSQDYGDKWYNFLISIEFMIKGRHLSLDTLRATFKLKNKTEIHAKLIEVFSYRNDLSQRRMIIEEVFNLLLSKHRFEIPQHFVLRRQEDILLGLEEQPDYHVYKTQKDFLSCVGLLAEKQLKEEIIIDQISYKENITLDIKDLQNYLHFFNNKRIKEFIYFRPLIGKTDNFLTPVNASVIYQAALREKTLNHVIFQLVQ
jgi:FKBP-type peptidyl-prolyl cis-trans isomerase (trigger factor)